MKEVILVKKGEKPVLMVDGREMAMRFPKEEQGMRVDLVSGVGSSDSVSTKEGSASNSFMTEEQKLTLATELVEGAESRKIEDKYCLINGIA